MRLICGLVRLDGAPAERAKLDAMVEALTAPGLVPSVGCQVEGSAALAVLDFAAPAGEPPSVSVEDDGTWLAADVRLDCAAELVHTLSLSRDASTDAIMHAAMARWRLDLPAKVAGDFALAAWNPSRRTLLCARDAMGVRPLCYAHEAGRWCAFASLPRGLFASGVVPPRADVVALGALLVEQWHPERTGYQRIAWLRAGHALEVTPDAHRVHRAWRPSVRDVGQWKGSAADAAATLGDLIERAVACRLPARGHVAADLSGGLDSSAVAVLAARALRRQGRHLFAFSQVPRPQPPLELLSEQKYVDAVLAQERDIVASPVYLPEIDVSAAAPDVCHVLGTRGTEATCAAARRAGASILLSGSGGDEGATYNGAGLRGRLSQQPWVRVAARLRQRIARWRPPSGYDQSDALRLLRPALARRIKAALQPVPNLHNRPADRIWAVTDSYLSSRATTWAVVAARHGIALSHPLSDRRIIDFTLSLPLERLVDHGFARQPFRNAMAGILPEEIRWRESKFASFPDGILRFAQAKRDLRAAAQRLHGNAPAAGFVDLDALVSAIDAIPEQEEACRLALGVNRGGTSATIRGTAATVRALLIALHIAQLE